MKPQDIIFFLSLFVLVFKKDPDWLVIMGLVCLLLAIPLFVFKIFFSAEHLVYYAAGFISIAIIFYIFTLKKGL